MLVILTAEAYGKPGKSENPELYVAFPYRLYGIGKPNLDLVRRTYTARLFPQNTCWGRPYQTTVQGHVEGGKITDLKVAPESRAKDVVVVD